jgi:hypothetical protein
MNLIAAPDRALAAAALYALAEQILHLSDAPVPQRVVLYRHELSAHELLKQADDHGSPIRVMSTCATAMLPLASLEQNGIEIDFTLFSYDLSSGARLDYQDHNRNCVSGDGTDHTASRPVEPIATQPLPPADATDAS